VECDCEPDGKSQSLSPYSFPHVQCSQESKAFSHSLEEGIRVTSENIFGVRNSVLDSDPQLFGSPGSELKLQEIGKN
jgi:hypothetical protein